MAQSIYVKTDTDEFVLKGRLCEVSAHSFIPPERNNPKELNYYNSDKKVLPFVYIGYRNIWHDFWQFNSRLLLS